MRFGKRKPKEASESPSSPSAKTTDSTPVAGKKPKSKKSFDTENEAEKCRISMEKKHNEVSTLLHGQTQETDRIKPEPRKASTGAISKTVDPESLSTKSSQTSKPKKTNNPPRFSLRRLFYGTPLFATPFLPSPLGAAMSGPGCNKNSRRRRNRKRQPSSNSVNNQNTVAAMPVPSSNEPSTSWRDNASSCSDNMIRECPLCLSSFASDRFPALINCYHNSCIDCLQFYIKIELSEGRVNIKCPQCVIPMHPNDIESLIGDKNSHLQKLYEFLMLRRNLSTDPDTRWCPGPNCSYAVIATGCASCPKITCERPGCGYSFCYHCKAEWHPNQTCDLARQQRQQPMMRASSVSFSQESGLHSSEVKICPRCNVLIVKMDDGSCNHMTCTVCSAEFCWLCMKEISDLHYLSPSGCTFWGKKPWSRKKKLMWQLGTLVGAPIGIALLAGISIPAMIIGIPVWVGRKIHARYSLTNRHRRNLAITGGVIASILISPVLAGLAVSIGVPILLAYVYGVVPISLCRSEGCGVSTSSSGVKIDIDEEMPYRPIVLGSNQVANPSIGEVSLGASLSLGSACHLEERGLEISSTAGDRESASNTAIAGTSRTVSLASSYRMTPGIYNSNCQKNDQVRLEVGADVHSRKKMSLSSERLSETVSLSERSVTASLAENDGTASTRALAGSLLAYRLGDSQSVGSYRMATPGMGELGMAGTSGDEISLKSLPGGNNVNLNSAGNAYGATQRSFSPISNLSGDELVSRRSVRKGRQQHLDKQLSENSSLLSTEDATSERVRFDDNVSVIDERVMLQTDDKEVIGTNESSINFAPKIHKSAKLETPRSLPEETPEELAMVISPEPKRNLTILPLEAGNNITTLSIGGGEDDVVATKINVGKSEDPVHECNVQEKHDLDSKNIIRL